MARRDVSLQYTTGEKTFDWGQLVKEDRGLEWIRLRALLGDADTRRPPFFPLKCSCESRRARGVGRCRSGARGIETLHTSGRRY